MICNSLIIIKFNLTLSYDLLYYNWKLDLNQSENKNIYVKIYETIQLIYVVSSLIIRSCANALIIITINFSHHSTYLWTKICVRRIPASHINIVFLRSSRWFTSTDLQQCHQNNNDNKRKNVFNWIRSIWILSVAWTHGVRVWQYSGYIDWFLPEKNLRGRNKMKPLARTLHQWRVGSLMHSNYKEKTRQNIRNQIK